MRTQEGQVSWEAASLGADGNPEGGASGLDALRLHPRRGVSDHVAAQLPSGLGALPPWRSL